MAQIIAYQVERKLADTLPMTVCGFILVLYVLSIFRILSWIDYVCIPILLIEILWIIINGLYKETFGAMFSIQNVCVYLFLVLIVASQLGRIATSWDDIYNWSCELKSMWYEDGLAHKYLDVAPEYGDYPPAVQLFRWFFVHMNSAYYSEGLAYAGYMCLNFILPLPLMSKLDTIVAIKEKIYVRHDEEVEVRVTRNSRYHRSDKKLVSKYKVRIAGDNGEILGEKIMIGGCAILLGVNILACISLLLLPSIAGSFCFESGCMDVTVGIIYGMLLWSIYDKDDEHAWFYFGRIACIGAVLVLSRSSGWCWALFALAFMSMHFWNENKGRRYSKTALFENKVRLGIYAIVSWIIAGVSWLIICLFKGRISIWTSSVFDTITSEDINIGYYASVKIVAYLKGLLLYPMYTGEKWQIDMPMSVLIILIIAAVFVLYKKSILGYNMAKLFLIFISATAIITYVVILITHLTLFTADVRYDEAFIISSVSRFSAPWVLGNVILLICVFITERISDEDQMAMTEETIRNQMSANRYRSVRMTYMVVAIVILLTSDVVACYRGMIGYRSTVWQDTKVWDEHLDEEERKFIGVVSSTSELAQARILYLKDAGNVRWRDNAYINYELSPTSIVYGALSYETSKEKVEKMIAQSHARYIYVESIEDAEVALAQVLEWQHTSDQGTVGLYRVSEDGRIEPYRTTIEFE